MAIWRGTQILAVNYSVCAIIRIWNSFPIADLHSSLFAAAACRWWEQCVSNAKPPPSSPIHALRPEQTMRHSASEGWKLTLKETVSFRPREGMTTAVFLLAMGLWSCFH